MTHPRTVEMILDGLLGNSSMKDALLGDLRQEWSERASESGERAANGWYRVQALRTVPHLLLQWWRETPWHALLGAALAILVVRMLTMIFGMMLLILVAWPLSRLGLGLAFTTILGSVGTSLAAFAGGALIARAFRQTPVPAVIWLFMLTVITTFSLGRADTQGVVAPWYLITDKVFSVAAVLFGAALAMRRNHTRAVRAA